MPSKALQEVRRHRTLREMLEAVRGRWVAGKGCLLAGARVEGVWGLSGGVFFCWIWRWVSQRPILDATPNRFQRTESEFRN